MNADGEMVRYDVKVIRADNGQEQIIQLSVQSGKNVREIMTIAYNEFMMYESKMKFGCTVVGVYKPDETKEWYG